jgi:ATP-binding protein involved in chromosome partitioning
MNVHFLGALPLDPQVRIGGDSGKPVTLLDASDPHAAGFVELAKNVLVRVEETSAAAKPPAMTIED